MKDTFADVRVVRRLILAYGAEVHLEGQAGPPVVLSANNLNPGTSVLGDAAVTLNLVSERTLYLDRAAGMTITLPAPVAGYRAKFVVKTISTSGGYVIVSAGGANIIAVSVAALDGNAGVTDDNADTVTLVANNHNVGDTLTLESDGTLYYLTGTIKAANGLTTATT